MQIEKNGDHIHYPLYSRGITFFHSCPITSQLLYIYIGIVSFLRTKFQSAYFIFFLHVFHLSILSIHKQ